MNISIADKNKTGIYGIRNTSNGKWYIGSASICLYTRLHSHLHHLRKGDHHSRHLQSAWAKYGEESFEYVVLEYVKSEECLSREQVYLDKLGTANPEKGYNIQPIAASPLGTKRTKETKSKLSEIAKGRTEEQKQRLAEYSKTPEAKAKISATHRDKIVSDGTRQKLREANLGKQKSTETKQKLKESLARRNPEYREKISIANKGKKRSTQAKQNYSNYAKNRTPEHQAKITASLRARAEKRRQEKLGIPTDF